MKTLVKKALAYLGYKLVKIPKPMDPKVINIFIDETFDDIYRKNNFIFADIGARWGIPKEWKAFEKYMKVVGFEPDMSSYLELENEKKQNVKYYNVALYNEKTPLDIYITRGGGQSSIFPPNRIFLDKFQELPIDRWDVVRTEKVSADKLDNVLKDSDVKELDYMKIDTQGSEKHILEGASNICRESVLCLEVESFFLDAYKNQLVFSDVDALARELGFYLFDLRKYYWRRNFINNIRGYKGQLIFCEALYLKMVEKIPLSISKYLKAISFCIFYGFFDYALEILTSGFDQSIFNNKQYNIILNSLIKYSTGFQGIINYDDKAIGNYPWFQK